jgi:NADP-dependent 3-hydroxy acid dehydrogenase YdfG
MIDVNIRGVLHGIAAVLPGMEARGFGQIINISSIGGLSVTPTAAVYCATKFARQCNVCTDSIFQPCASICPPLPYGRVMISRR